MGSPWDGSCRICSVQHADVFGFWREGFAGGVVWLDSLESTDGWFDVSGSMHGTDGTETIIMLLSNAHHRWTAAVA